jgi:hypothetical protein
MAAPRASEGKPGLNEALQYRFVIADDTLISWAREAVVGLCAG